MHLPTSKPRQSHWYMGHQDIHLPLPLPERGSWTLSSTKYSLRSSPEGEKLPLLSRSSHPLSIHYRLWNYMIFWPAATAKCWILKKNVGEGVLLNLEWDIWGGDIGWTPRMLYCLWLCVGQKYMFRSSFTGDMDIISTNVFSFACYPIHYSYNT